MKNKKNSRSGIVRHVLFLLCLMALSISLSGRQAVFAAGGSQKILPTNVSSASSDCMLVGIEGSFATQVQEALDRINEIRYEACQEGVPSPGAPERPLGINDYVPIEWSSSLEYIARIRAAEAIVCVSHTRPNGTSCFALEAPDGTSSFGEVLAWNFMSGGSMAAGINMWYEEKADWVAQNKNAVTGHYTSMIDPKNKYIGMGAFASDFGVWGCSISGEFSTRDSFGKAQAEEIKNCIQTIEVQKSAVKGMQIFAGSEAASEYNMGIGKQQLSARLKVVIDGDTSFCSSLDELKWSTSDSAVADVDASGAVTAKKAGRAVISVSAGDQSASCALTVEDSKQPEKPDQPDTPDQSDADVNVKLSQSVFEYNGSAQKPKVTVLMDGRSVNSSSYTVKYSKGCKKPGIYTVTVNMTGDYSGTAREDFIIIPKGTSLKSVKGGSGSITAQWKKQTKQTDGYILWISDTKEPDGSGRELYVAGNKNTKQVIGQLERNHTYYVRIRTYKISGKNAVCSEWSKVKKVKTK